MNKGGNLENTEYSIVNHKDYRQLKSLELYREGLKAKDIAQIMGLSRRTVERYIKQYKLKDLHRLLSRECALNLELQRYQRRALDIILSKSPREYGFYTQVWTVAMVNIVIKELVRFEENKMTYSKSYLYKLIGEKSEKNEQVNYSYNCSWNMTLIRRSYISHLNLSESYNKSYKNYIYTIIFFNKHMNVWEFRCVDSNSDLNESIIKEVLKIRKKYKNQNEDEKIVFILKESKFNKKVVSSIRNVTGFNSVYFEYSNTLCFGESQYKMDDAMEIINKMHKKYSLNTERHHLKKSREIRMNYLKNLREDLKFCFKDF